MVRIGTPTAMTPDPLPRPRAVEQEHAERCSPSVFRRLAQATSNAVGTPTAFVTALAVVGLWAISGPVFHFSDTWQLVINTGTTVVTFLMIFLVQHTQNRETAAIRLQLDELIYAMDSARNELLAVDDLSDEDLRRLRDEFRLHALERGVAVRRRPARARRKEVSCSEPTTPNPANKKEKQ
jgi:low affinity Fe/Cu permease